VELAQTVAWIQAHGSERLRRILDGGYLFGSLAVYCDERLALERPGWWWSATTPGKVAGGPRNPTVEAFALLDQALAVDPAATLRYRAVPGAGRAAWAVAQFLGRPVVYGFRGPTNYQPRPPRGAAAAPGSDLACRRRRVSAKCGNVGFIGCDGVEEIETKTARSPHSGPSEAKGLLRWCVVRDGLLWRRR
jgi:hypothetical protein